MNDFVGYPRTPHIEGSKLQPGDSDSDQTTIRDIVDDYPGAFWFNEEKLDGANCAVSYDDELNQQLQSRGHYLTGGARERQFGLLKEWACFHDAEILERLEDRYIAFGEWTFARHTQFYDKLPHYFHEFDIWDKKEGIFLSTPRRHALLDGSPLLSVPVVGTAAPRNQKELRSWVGKSLYRSDDWRKNLAVAAERAGVDPERALEETGAHKPDADLCEGLYIKIEDADQVLARFKFVRQGFVQTILESGQHWSQRPMIRNMLADGVDLFQQVAATPSP